MTLSRSPCFESKNDRENSVSESTDNGFGLTQMSRVWCCETCFRTATIGRRLLAEMRLSHRFVTMLPYSRLTSYFAVALNAIFGTALGTRSAAAVSGCAWGSTPLGQSAAEDCNHPSERFCGSAADGAVTPLQMRSPLAWPPFLALTPSLPL